MAYPVLEDLSMEVVPVLFSAEFWDLAYRRTDPIPEALAHLQALFAKHPDEARSILLNAINKSVPASVVLSYWVIFDNGVFTCLLNEVLQTSQSSGAYFPLISALQRAADKAQIEDRSTAEEIAAKIPTLSQTLAQICVNALDSSRQELGNHQFVDHLLLEIVSNSDCPAICRTHCLVKVCKANPEVRPGKPLRSEEYADLYAPLFEPVAMAEVLLQLPGELHDSYWSALGYPRSPEVRNAILLALGQGLGIASATQIVMTDCMSAVDVEAAVSCFSACLQKESANPKAVLAYWLAACPASLINVVNHGIKAKTDTI